MDYHEIGEIFEYNGVLLEVVPSPIYKFDACSHCHFYDTCTHEDIKCTWSTRKDGMNIVFKYIGKREEEARRNEMNVEIQFSGADKTLKITEDMAGQQPNSTNETISMNDIIDNLKQTLVAKNEDYGSAFSEMFDELGIDYAYGKLREKINRIKVLRNQPNMVENEGLEDALLDTAGYAILTLVELKKRSNGVDKLL